MQIYSMPLNWCYVNLVLCVHYDCNRKRLKRSTSYAHAKHMQARGKGWLWVWIPCDQEESTWQTPPSMLSLPTGTFTRFLTLVGPQRLGSRGSPAQGVDPGDCWGEERVVCLYA